MTAGLDINHGIQDGYHEMKSLDYPVSFQVFECMKIILFINILSLKQTDGKSGMTSKMAANTDSPIYLVCINESFYDRSRFLQIYEDYL